MGGRIDTDNFQYYIVVLYRFNNNTNIEGLLGELSNLLDGVSSNRCFILGDFNFNLFNFNTNRYVERYSEVFFTRGFAPLISKPTHVFKSSITLIDQIWCNFVDESLYSGVIDISLSNHKPLFFMFPGERSCYDTSLDSRDNHKKYIAHNISSKNIEKFSSKFNTYFDQHYTTVVSNDFTSDPEIAQNNFTNFFNDFKTIYDDTILEEVDLNSNRNFIKKPWITLGIAKSCSVKNKLYNKWVRARGSPNEMLAMNSYKSYRSKLKDIIKDAQNNYYVKRFEKSKNDIKKCWKVINQIRCKNRSLIYPDYLVDNDSLITDSIKIKFLELLSKFSHAGKGRGQKRVFHPRNHMSTYFWYYPRSQSVILNRNYIVGR